jgi:nucleoside-diphosphate-sugar epimerase
MNLSNKSKSKYRKKTALVCGAGGFIGSHLVKQLKNEGFWIRGVDLKYPEFAEIQADPDNPGLPEDSAYPAAPDSEYGWEKLFSERLYLSYYRNYGLKVRIARFHNIFGPEGTWTGGKEKVPAAMCRKIAEAENHSEIEMWGDGKQTRSFLYIDECLIGVRKLIKNR